jgi:hypothetical protein
MFPCNQQPLKVPESTSGIAASCGACAGSLVRDAGCCSLPRTAYCWWPWLVPTGSLRVLGVWYRGWISRTVHVSSAVGGGLIVRGISWLNGSKRLWLRGSRRTCDGWFLRFLGTKSSRLCFVYSIGAAVVTWRFYCVISSQRFLRRCWGWGGDRLPSFASDMFVCG